MLVRFGRALLCFLLVLGVTPAWAQNAPEQRVAELNATLLQVMKGAEALGYEGRYARLGPALDQVFDFEEMARAAAGSYWGRLQPAERERYVDAFRRMSIATFASRFDGYSGESLEVVGQKPGPRDAVMVDTRIASPGEAPVSISYVFRETGAGPRVVDVYLDSTYSEIAVKRSEYTSLLRQGGVERLIEALDRRIADMKENAAG